jgi:hypothetical protein
VVVNHKAEDVTGRYSAEAFDRTLKNASPEALLSNDTITGEMIPRMQEKADALAEQAARPLIAQSLASVQNQLDEEINRLIYLQQVNHSISNLEIEQCRLEKDALEKQVKTSRVRLDSIRIIWRGNAERMNSTAFCS